MKRSAPAHIVACAALSVVLAACASKGATPVVPPTATPAVRATPVPPVLVDYASATTVSLKAAIDKTTTLMATIDHKPWSDVARDCADAGEQYSIWNASFTGTAPLPAAQTYSSSAIKGFTLALRATDECSTAADAGIGSDLRAARGDFNRALNDLTSAEAGIAPWSASHP